MLTYTYVIIFDFHVPFLQWHLVRFPHEIGGESYTCRAGLLENIHRVSKGWSCVAETEDCLVLRNSLHRLRQGSMLRCLVLWWLGESHTLYNKNMEWECIQYMCMSLIWMKSLETLSPVPQQKDMDMHFQFHNQWCVGVEFLSTLECEVLL